MLSGACERLGTPAPHHPLRRLLGELASVAAVERVAVPLLSLEAVRELASSHGADGDAIYALTRGNRSS